MVVILPGALLPRGFQNSMYKTCSHVSAGMIVSVRGLGLGANHDGALVLSTLGLGPEIDSNALDLLGLHGEVVEINVTPDRGSALPILGVAREYCHAA